jgi:triosephosphate isomerase
MATLQQGIGSLAEGLTSLAEGLTSLAEGIASLAEGIASPPRDRLGEGMRQIIAGNWKMNTTTASAAALAMALREGVPGCDMLVCPPATQIVAVATVLAGSPVMVGGQDCHAEPCGAHTGDIAASMLRDTGAGWVILGHSERRAGHGETDAMVRDKVVAAQGAGLRPIVCVGESAAERKAGRQDSVVGGHLAGSLPPEFDGVVAYEPIWAIGAGASATEADVSAMHGFIRAALVRQFGERGAAIRILYGGSVKPDNAAGLLALPEVGGALVGGASLVAADFLAIARATPRWICG